MRKWFPVLLWAAFALSMVAYLLAHGAAMAGGVSHLMRVVPGAALVELSVLVLCVFTAAAARERSGSYRLLCVVTGALALTFGLSYFVPLGPLRLLNPMVLPLHFFGLVLPFVIGIAGLWAAASARGEP
jgi:hypothetical protein